MASSGLVVTYRELDDRSSRAAAGLRVRGLRPSDGIAILVENQPRFLEVCWAAQRSGLFYTPISTRLKPSEAAYILRNCGACVLITSPRQSEVAGELRDLVPEVAYYSAGGEIDGFESYDALVDASPLLDDEEEGSDFLYSSGSTGRPKGVRLPRPSGPIGGPDRLTNFLVDQFGFDERSVFLSTAPLYHAAPLRFSRSVQRLGGTVVLMERFDPEAALAAIDRYGVTHSQWVPTMFTRMLRLPEASRSAHDLSSMRYAIHAAAPCPVHVKEAMIGWWGPILYEYYSGTEAVGFTVIEPDEWMEHKGSVGRPHGCTLHVVDDEGVDVDAGTPGLVYFENPAIRFRYHEDDEGTRASRHPEHEDWATLGDVGWLDRDGYLYLTDRRDFTIISGGINVSSQEIEHALLMHPAVEDVAVVGQPDDDFGQVPRAFVQLRESHQPSADLADELRAHCQATLATYKCPRSIEFVGQLPRDDTGKIFKRKLVDAGEHLPGRNESAV